jgi:hypothetical protein
MGAMGKRSVVFRGLFIRSERKAKVRTKISVLLTERMSTVGAIIKQNAMIVGIVVFFAATTVTAFAQTAYDAGARIALADEINQTYGQSVNASLSVSELFDIKNRLDVAVSIEHKYGVQLDYREHSFIELCDIAERIHLTVSINRNYGKNVDWRSYGYNQLLEMDNQLESESQSRPQKPASQTPSQTMPHTG